jgi:hypothetical protein
MRHGSAHLDQTNFGYVAPLYIGAYITSPLATPATLMLNSSSVTLNIGAYSPTDGNNVFGLRQADIDASGSSSAVMFSQGPGTSSANISIGYRSTFAAYQNFGGQQTVIRVGGDSSATFVNVGAELFRTQEQINTAVVGNGSWNLWDDDHILFMHDVGQGQSVNLHRSSLVEMKDPTHFQGSINAGSDWSSQLWIEMGNPITAADYVRDMTTGASELLLTAANGQHAQIRFSDPSAAGFELEGTPWGAMLAPDAGRAVAPGDTTLIRHIGAPTH